MATRLYFDSTVVADLAPPAPGAEWEHTSLSVTRRLNRTAQSSPMTDFTANYDVADHLVDQDGLHAQFVSAPLTASQTIGVQTLKWQVRAREGDNGNNLFATIKVYLIDQFGAAGGTILAITRDNTEVTVSVGVRQNRQFSATTSSVTTSAAGGDRIVVEVGLGGLPTAAAGNQGHNGILVFGDDSTDLPEDDTTTTANNPWVEFGTSTLTFLTLIPPPFDDPSLALLDPPVAVSY